MKLCALILSMVAIAACSHQSPATKHSPTVAEAAAEKPAPPTAHADIEGTWQGVLKAQGIELRVVFHIAKDEAGALSATMDSPDQGITGIPVQKVKVTGNAVRLEIPPIQGIYEGALAGDKIDGTWSQGGAKLPLALDRVEDDAAATLRRPQTPKPPFPYRAEDVSFPGGEKGVTLAGTLTLPKGDGPHPAVVLITGSGPQDRDETIFGHKPFFVLADMLTRRGIAVLRYDDRGAAASTGDFSTATMFDFAADAQAAVNFLRTREDILDEEIGLLGHSEGGYVAPLVATRSGQVDFLVLLAGPSVSGAKVLARQNALFFEGRKMSSEGAARYAASMLKALGRITSIPIEKPVPDKVRAAVRADLEAAAAAMSPEDRKLYGPTEAEAFGRVLDGMIKQLTSPGMRSFLGHDPQPVLKKVDVPILALFGEKDFQVPDKQSAGPMRKALADNKDATVVVIPGANHLFQPAETGLLSEYGQIETTIAPEVLERIGNWIEKQTP